jgi:hypothetical protein
MAQIYTPGIIVFRKAKIWMVKGRKGAREFESKEECGHTRSNWLPHWQQTHSAEHAWEMGGMHSEAVDYLE